MEYLYNKDQIKRHLIRIENYSSTFDSRIFSSRYFFQFGVSFLEQGRLEGLYSFLSPSLTMLARC